MTPNCTASGFDVADFTIKVLIPVFVAFMSFYIARKSITNAGVTQFRQKWIDTLRDSISLFVARAEMISRLDPDDENSDDIYDEHFMELTQMQHKIELLLNPTEDDHNELVKLINEIRDWIHEEEASEEEMDEGLNILLDELMIVSKRVLKREWRVVKKGK